jgi:sugar lactone lactonase YvrE
MKRARRAIGAALLAVVVYLCTWPTAVEPLAWQAPAAPAPSGPFAPNRKLAGFTLLAPDLDAPESVAVDGEGALYTGTLDGRVVRVDPNSKVASRTLAQLGGRPLGLRVLPSGDLVIAVAHEGLVRIDPSATPAKVERLVDRYRGRALGFLDDVEPLPDGTLLFTEASTRFGLAEYELDGLEHRPSGNLFAFDPRTRKVGLVRSGLYFANGVAAAPDGSYALVSETWAYRVRRVFLSGPRKGESDIVIDNLPGFPDNVTYDRARDLFWVALASPRDAGLDALSGLPFVRKMVARLPKPVRPGPRRHAMAVAIRGDGTLLGYLDDDSADSYSPLTSVRAAGDQLYLGSLSHRGIGRIRLPTLRP